MSPRVTMLVTNPVRHDNRVLKEARVLRDAGYQVTIVGTYEPGAPRDEIVDGVRILLVDPREGYRHRRARSYMRRREHVAGLYRRTHARIIGVIPVLPSFVGRAITKVARKTALFPFRTAHRLVQETMASAHRLESTLSWKVEPLVFLRDFSEAVFGVAAELEAEVWHAHDLDTLPAALALRDAFGGKVVYDAHEYWLDCNNHYTPFAKAVWAELERECAPRADAVVTVSRSIAKLLAAEYDIAEPAVVLNAPTYERAARSGDLRARLGVAADRFLLIYVGLVTVGRGYEQLFEALAQVPEAELAVLGPGLAEYKEALRSLAAERGVGGRVHFLEPVPVREIQHLTAGADAGIVVVQRDAVSYELCLPSKFFEYIFAGIPVAVSDLPELRPIVEAYGIGVCFDERDPASIAAGIRALQRDRARYAGPDWEAKVAQVAAQYDWEVRKHDLLDVYAAVGVKPGVSA